MIVYLAGVRVQVIREGLLKEVEIKKMEGMIIELTQEMIVLRPKKKVMLSVAKTS
ncbi:hypothetical protein FORC53_1259 [Vibrio vulnificus]|uniref:Uncharacterized protein n=1 Tax=Vibrio vulnificus TaxID=672 RepID=A0AAN1PMU7_VIBVL|nr:hypothetical protein FORC53_1259 [Vibrio vulnificus]